MPVVLSLLGGSVDVESSNGTRTIEAAELFVGPMETSLHHDEIAVSAFFPALADGTGVAFDEITRRHGDYALCGVAATVQVAGGDVVEARAGYLSVNEVPTVVDLTAALHEGVDESTLAEAGELALGSLEPAADIHATQAYRAHLVRVLTARVLHAAYDDALARAQ
jgi:2-furoyl-CoA dehydrogenase FAD binding subunit